MRASLWSRPGSTPLAALLLFLATCLARIPFASQMLYGWDSANFALALDYYNVAWHQPHPPGYPLYVALGKLFDLLFHDANASFVAISVITSAGAVSLLFLLGRRMYGPWVGLAAGALLAFAPGFWGYGEVAYPYTSLAFFGTLVAYLCYRIWQGDRSMAIPCGLALGVAGGFRQDILVFMGPLWLVSLWQAGIPRLVASGVAAVAMVAAWLIPAAQLSGGWQQFQEAGGAQTAYIMATYSAFAQGLGQVRANAVMLLLFLQQMFGLSLMVVIYYMGRFLTLKSLVADHRLAFLLLWFVPPVLVYTLVHIGEPGYVLSLLPPLALTAAVGLADVGNDARSAAQLLAGRRGWPRLGEAAGRIGAATALVLLSGLLLWGTVAFTNSVGPGRLREIRTIDNILARQTEYVRQYPPGSVMVLAKIRYRQLKYYLPGYDVRLLFDEYRGDYGEVRYEYQVPLGVNSVLVMDFGKAPSRFPGVEGGQIVLDSNPRYWVDLWRFQVRPGDIVEYGDGHFGLKGRN